MNNVITNVFLVFLLVAAISCGKQEAGVRAPQTDTTNIVGKWTWVRSNFLFNLLAPRSGVHKELDFTTTGAVYIKHNDSTGQDSGPYIAVPPLSRLTLLSNDVTDTVSYHFSAEPVGCPVREDQKATFAALIIDKVSSQFRISNDTLYLVTPPCLVQPDSVIYVKTKAGNTIGLYAAEPDSFRE